MEELSIHRLFQEIQSYYKKLIQSEELPPQENIDDVQGCFRIICQVVDSFLCGYAELQKQYVQLEEQLIKSEAENRQHIRVEQQLKIYAENLQEQCELLEKQSDEQNYQINGMFKELTQLRKRFNLHTDSTQERLQTIVSQQKAHTIPIKIKKKRTPTAQSTIQVQSNSKSSGKSISQQGQYSTIERMSDVMTKKKKPKRSVTQHTKTSSKNLNRTKLSATSFHMD